MKNDDDDDDDSFINMLIIDNERERKNILTLLVQLLKVILSLSLQGGSEKVTVVIILHADLKIVKLIIPIHTTLTYACTTIKSKLYLFPFNIIM